MLRAKLQHCMCEFSMNLHCSTCESSECTVHLPTAVRHNLDERLSDHSTTTPVFHFERPKCNNDDLDIIYICKELYCKSTCHMNLHMTIEFMFIQLSMKAYI